ncbi:sphingomyelin phosphodiesterase [Moritella viscosa]|uniref:Phospholipase C n=1 Tax=Moritella viscosa TaxID=80854 RepID=A0ABY1HM80_9GAMM|nr:sphingomyelin phosphodiesterase [Moritella viscosa]CED59057.1 putative exported phospholipase [Moritella viscosa]SGZ04263.1 Putative phospholipase C [Moritella viscosa]SGZ07143.1 Putative phospholipase C [Moritella viscosa]SGZ18780.1 Putative phospholipase C [Moritella viscosa]SHN99182.1 Putative phospholipase C [Moritella viscosa]
MLRKIAVLLGLYMITPVLMAMSQVPTERHTIVQFTNSTPHTLYAYIEKGNNIELLTAEVMPLSTVDLANITRFSTDDDIAILLSNGDYNFSLTQRVTNGELAFGIDSHELTIEPQTNSAIQRFEIQLADRKNTIAFNSEKLNKGGKVNYVLQLHDQKPAIGPGNEFSLLSYNIWATTIFGSKKVSDRLTEMPEIMSGYDALVLTEVFDPIRTKKLLKQLSKEYSFTSSEIFKLGKIMQSGTRILTPWPVEEEKSLKYTNCNGIQCAATRGVIYARINKQGYIYHVFATHTQSSDDDSNRSARLAQLEEMGEFIREQNIPANEAVILAGDFNVNKIGLPGDRDQMEYILNASEPENKGHNLSFDSNTNYWAEKPYLEYLDYTLTGNDNLQPMTASQEIFAPRVLTESLWGIWDLSDHYAARGYFIYPTEK